MIEKLYFLYIGYFDIISKIIVLAIFSTGSYMMMKKNNNKKIIIFLMIIMFSSIGFNSWMNSYSYKFGEIFAKKALNKEKKIILEEYNDEKIFLKEDISIEKLLKLVEENQQITIIVETPNEINYMFWYAPRPEEYGVFKCNHGKKCLRIGAMKNKDFVTLIEKKIEEEKYYWYYRNNLDENFLLHGLIIMLIIMYKLFSTSWFLLNCRRYNFMDYYKEYKKTLNLEEKSYFSE